MDTKKILKYFKNPKQFFLLLGNRELLNFLNDKNYLKLMYWARMDRKLNLDNPVTYNEKLQWLKLNERNNLYPKLVDKYEVRSYVENKIGSQYLIPLLGAWESFDKIDFDQLPNKFVLKTTHDSGGVVICQDKNMFDKVAAKKKLNKSMRNNYYWGNREWVYKDLKPKIIAEEYLEDENNKGLDDYKFFCFNGEVKAMFIASDRDKETKFDFYDRDFNRLPLKQFYPNSEKTIEKPINYEKMISLAEKLSENIPHVRVDFYNKKGKIYFGELTFYHFSGTRKFEPAKYDRIFGQWIDLELVENNK